MSERFKALYKLEENLYKENSPLIISAGVLLKDEKTATVITQLKFQSVTKHIIKTIKIAIDAFDVSNKQIKGIEEYHYLDLTIRNGEFFGFNKAIIMPESITRSIKIKKLNVIYEDGTFEINGRDLLPIDKSEKLSSFFDNSEIIKQYQLDSSSPAKFAPTHKKDLWICDCGCINSTDVCTKCSVSKEVVFKTYTVSALEENLKRRLEKEKLEREQQEKLALIAKKEQEEKEEKDAKRKRKRKLCSLIACLSVIAVIIVSSISSFVQHKNTINTIETLVENKQYEHAFDEINKSKLSYSGKSAYIEKIKPEMITQFEEKMEQFQVLNMDGLAIYKEDNVIYYFDGNGKQIELYKSREGDGQYRNIGDGLQYWMGGGRIRMGFAFIYSNGYIIFLNIMKKKW